MSGSSRSAATQKPWDIQIPYLESGFKKAQHLFDAEGPEYYKDKTLAEFTKPEVKSQKGIMHLAQSDAVKKMGTDARSQLSKTYGLANRLGTEATR